eukprot:GHUV01043155.1.p2 GENE.GHUV01043155.1~~GHUV01043155.1.p2  ORF type:complete len:107 (-),score=29.47 GHUV01043155.1:908-1228(-)
MVRLASCSSGVSSTGASLFPCHAINLSQAAAFGKAWINARMAGCCRLNSLAQQAAPACAAAYGIPANSPPTADEDLQSCSHAADGLLPDTALPPSGVTLQSKQTDF